MRKAVFQLFLKFSYNTLFTKSIISILCLIISFEENHLNNFFDENDWNKINLMKMIEMKYV